MAFSASTVWEVESGGDDTNNGGGFDTGVAGFPTDGAATSGTGTAPVFSSASYNFVAGDVGHWVYIKSGSNWLPGWYKIASVAANAATLNASVGTATVGLGIREQGNLNTTQGVATVASPSGATWGIDYSQNTAAQISFTDMVIDGTTNTKFTSAANPVGKNFIGNIISVTSGTGFTVQRVTIASTSTITATCDKSLGTLSSTGGTGKLGGAFASPGKAGSVFISSNFVFMKSGTYSVTSTSTNIAAGCIIGTGVTQLTFMGYKTIRGDLNTMTSNPSDWPLMQASGAITTFTLFTCGATGWLVANIAVDGVAKVSSRGFNLGSSSGFVGINLGALNCTNNGIEMSALGTLIRSYATGCSTQTAIRANSTGSVFLGCEAYGNTISGFTTTGSGVYINCISSGNSGASSDGFGISVTGSVYMNCVAYGNGRDGYRLSVAGVAFMNCLGEENASGKDWNYGTNGAQAFINSGLFNSAPGGYGSIPVTSFIAGVILNTAGSFFTNAGTGDFSLNNTASRGAIARSTGFPGQLPRQTTTGYTDIGAARHADPVSTSAISNNVFVG